MDGMVQRRHALIAMAQRRQRPGTGSSPALLSERTIRVAWPDLGATLGAIPWAVVGAVATRLYMPERFTRDLDMLVAAVDGTAVRERLRDAGYTHLGELSIGGSTWRSREGVEVDVIECGAAWCSDALAGARENRDGQGLPILPLPYHGQKSYNTPRAQDVADLARMLGQADETLLEQARSAVRQYAPADLADLESLIALGKLEMATARIPRPGDSPAEQDSE